MRRGTTPIAAALALAVLCLSGCGGPAGRDSSPAAATDGEPYAKRTVTDCTGHTSTFRAAPARVATVTSSVLEMLLSLGLKDRIAGIQAVAPGAFRPGLERVADGLHKLSGEYKPKSYAPVQKEQLLNVQPDLVVGGWSSNFDAGLGALSQAQLTERDIDSYYAFSTSCEAASKAPVTDFASVYKDLDNYGRIFDVKAESDALVSGMREKVASVRERVGSAEPVSVFGFEYEEGTQTPYAQGNRTLAHAVITQAGGKNIFADLDSTYEKVSWEQVADRNPDAIAIVVYGKDTKAEFDEVVNEAEKFLDDFEPLAGVTAVKERRFIPVTYEEYAVGSVRNADAVAGLARELHPGLVG
ncbi:ABC transporter substrate-binding protein [Streptomyces sp. WMMC500]|uniref:ABC transporter substrate-binding protein n=1 Tax=Streptomyces sp. WMMC500 TaxID=3015154 RepID=UPI00248AEEF1|nr:ABC transporter substrate-binding protein [Streptomyces sp. WMMC500]WBB58903.1 ABC transporter substrate-binding protein [Streptomyces sp. WMMC500]